MPLTCDLEESLTELFTIAATGLNGVAVGAEGDHLDRIVEAVLGQVVDVVDLTSCAWGAGRFGRLRKGDPGAFDGFETAAAKCEQSLFRLLSSRVSYPTRLRSGSFATGGALRASTRRAK
jgi:hypothetical protein